MKLNERFKYGIIAQNIMAQIMYFSFKNFAYEAFQAIAYLKIDMNDGIIELDRVNTSTIWVSILHVRKDFSSDMSIFALVMVIIDEHIIL